MAANDSPVSRLGLSHNGHAHFPRPGSPTGSVRSAFSTTRRRGFRSSGGGGFSRASFKFARAHRGEASKELSLQAEGEFLALAELLSGISRRSSSLKEVWSKIISERESWAREMDSLYEQFEEYYEEVERRDRDHHQHRDDHEGRKKEISKISIELTAAVTSIAEYKRKLAERDREYGLVQREIAEAKDNFKYLREEHETTKATLESVQSKLLASEEGRRNAEEDAKKHHGDLRSLRQLFMDLQTTNSELETKHDSNYKELVNLKSVTSVLKSEKHEWLHEKGELDETLRKHRHREDDYKRKIKEITELHAKKDVEVREVHESISKLKYEREELFVKIKELERLLDEEHNKVDTAEDQSIKWKLKYEHSEREISTIREELRIVRSEHTEVSDFLSKKTEEIKRLVVEKDRLEDSYHGKNREADEYHREILVLKETIRRTELQVKEKNETIHTLHERIERTELDRDDARKRIGDVTGELESLQASSASLRVQIENVQSEREGVREKLREAEARYEEVVETVEGFDEGSSGFEYEISTLRTMLREAREQKEKAIAMRNSADRERDEAIARYEAKCREIEKLEEEFSSQMQASSSFRSSGGGRHTTTRRVLRESSGGGISTLSEGDSFNE